MSGQRLVDVHLHGPLADKYGALHAFAITNPTEAVNALDANFPGFVRDFAEHGHYYIHADGDWRDGDKAALMPVGKELHLVPRIEGRAFLGGALVGALFPAIAGTAAATIIGGLLMTGLLLGVSYLLTPKQKGMATNADAGKDENYAFTGPENVTQQGVAVPLIYGRVYAGSVVVSAGLEMDVEYVVGQGTVALSDKRVGLTNAQGATVLASGGGAPLAGFPPLMVGPYGLQPKGWEPANRQIVIPGQRQGPNREALIWVSPYPADNGQIYAWTERAGFYSFASTSNLEGDQYNVAGGGQ